MQKIAWTDEFSVGVPILDRQHERLLGMLNKLAELPQTTTDSETISDILSDMTRYALEHLATEEKLMEQCGYPELEKHMRQHIQFRKKTVDLCSATMLGVGEVPAVLLTFLQKWLLHHILEEDMKYRPFMSRNGKSRLRAGAAQRNTGAVHHARI